MSQQARLPHHVGQGDGRLVLEAGIGTSAVVEQVRTDLPDARWS